MDSIDLLIELENMFLKSFAVPFTDVCIINRKEIIKFIVEIKRSLPEDITLAEKIKRDREQIIEDAKNEAKRIIENAKHEGVSLIKDHKIIKTATLRAEEILKKSRKEADVIRESSYTYLDTLMENLKKVISFSMEKFSDVNDEINKNKELLLDEIGNNDCDDI